MSVNSPAPAAPPVGTPEFPRHVVTAVLVAHDGARWLPKALEGLLTQDRPVQDVIACDTGSADDSARLLADALGDQRVLHLARRTGFGAAVDEAVRTAAPLTAEHLPYLRRRSGWDPVSRTWDDDAYDEPELPHGEPVQWLWLLHDDCEPDPGALAALLRTADASPSAAIVGPKLRSWYDRRQLLEVGVSIARSGRRWTGLERREQDQGQHDQTRQVLSVSSAGMLVRRDLWEELGGFDRRLPLMRDDVDFCWRAQAAGHTVLIAPDAVMRHAEAASRERRPVDCAGRSAVNPHRVDKAGAVYTLLVNTRGPLLPYVALRVVVGTLLRTLAYLVGKVPGQAVDEIVGLLGVLLRPERLLAARRARGRGAVPPSELRPLFPPPGATVRATVDQVVSNVAGRADDSAAAAGLHGGAVESGPGDEDGDFLEIEQFARLKRIARKPGPVLFAVLLVVSLLACRGLLGGGSLYGGALLPAESGASDLWATYAGSWHALGTGGTQSAPPYLAVLAIFATVLFGSTGLTLTLFLVASVPLAGVAAYFASRPLVESRLLRAWASVAYAFLPAATGALAAGRLGTAFLAILLPLMARAAVAAAGLQLGDAAVERGARPGWRATWALALMLTFTTAFTPVTWPIALVLAAATLGWRLLKGQRVLLVPHLLRSLALLVTPMVLLAPWSTTLLSHPGRMLNKAGLAYGTKSASSIDLLLLSPGGPKASGGFLLVGVVLAALAALMRGTRRTAIVAAWAAAVTGLLFAVIENGKDWAGPATLVYGLALLAAAAIGAEGANERIAASGFGWRQPVAALVALAAVLAPLLAAFTWVFDGADGPIRRGDPQQVPAFVAEESTTRDQPRTLVLNGTPGDITYALVRGAGAHLGDAELAAQAPADHALDSVVANLVAGSGADQGSRLAGYAIRYVLAQKGAPHGFARVLDSTPGLSRVSQTGGSELWRVESATVSRITIVAKGAATVPVASGRVEAHTEVPAGPAGRVLRLADSAAAGWHATLDGAALTPTTVDGWAQGFTLPAAGGRLDVTYQEPVSHIGWLGAQAFLLLLVVVLALPGRRNRIDDDLPEAEAAAAVAEAPGQASGEGRRARRLQAAAEAEAAAAAAAAASGLDADGGQPDRDGQGAGDPSAAGDGADGGQARVPAPSAAPDDAADGYAQTPYDPVDGGYDPYAVPAGAPGTDGYGYGGQGGYDGQGAYEEQTAGQGASPGASQGVAQGQGYGAEGYGGDGTQTWDGGPQGQQPYPAGPQDPAAGDGGYDRSGYGYVPPPPGYDPYAAPGQDGYGHDQGYADQAAQGYGGQQGYADGQQPYGESYGDQQAYPGAPGDGRGYPGQQQPYGEGAGYPDPSTYYAEEHPEEYAEGDPRRDGSDHQ
ncbi:glycosyltransferase [Actinacidiphila sp. DG2A-62]|uniref:glycosyltransferase n=1 Tax=Actinacidiphila sp. DG2A-62 TaxID=3108821 RepID=UPI002DB97DEB|nr:glycosyltransferase [Actinacidiphila sp. DG2A-62]MEC3994518.1 glycosyltransferase [Actinacidiphila sp. DG2A-62]